MTQEEIDDLVLKVYRARLNADHPDAADRQVRTTTDGEKAQRRWAQFYRPVVVATLIALGLHERPAPNRRAAAPAEEGLFE